MKSSSSSVPSKAFEKPQVLKDFIAIPAGISRHASCTHRRTRSECTQTRSWSSTPGTVFWRCLKMACSSTCLAAAKQGSGLQGWMLHQCSAIWELLLHHRSSELGMSPTLRVTVRYEGSLASIGESILSHLTRLSIFSCEEKHRGNSERRGLSEPARLKRWP